MSASTTAHTPTIDSYAASRAGFLRGVAVVVVGAALFFLALAALPNFREFIAGPGDGTLSGDRLIAFRTGVLSDHHSHVIIGYVLIGMGQLLLGLGTAMTALSVARAGVGRRARVAAWAALVLGLGGVLSCLAYAWPGYWLDEDALVGIGESTPSMMTFLATWVVLALGFLLLAAAVASRPWPRWTAVPLVVFAVLPFVTMLPLFFQVGAVIAGLGLAIGTRPTRVARMIDA